MKATLEFNLPEESIEHYDAINGARFKEVINEVLNHIRSKTKYSDPPKAKLQVYEEIRELIMSEMEDLVI